MLSEINEINKTLSSVPENKDSPQQTFHDIWHLIFGGFHNFVEKKRISRVVDLENFKMSLEHKIADIPKGSLVEPKLSTLGPALEASKYYIEEEQLREMFAKLIASSMDNRVDSKVHPAFVEIINSTSSCPFGPKPSFCFTQILNNFPVQPFARQTPRCFTLPSAPRSVPQLSRSWPLETECFP